MWKTFILYIKYLGIWGWVLMGLNLFTALGAFELYTKIPVLQEFPTWGWLLFLIIFLLFAPFLAFHKLRLYVEKLEKTLDDKKALTELKLEIDKLIKDGTYIRPVLNPLSNVWVERNDKKIEDWQSKIETTFKGTEWELYWQNSIELGKPPDKANMTDVEYESAVQLYWVNLKLQRLDKIREKL